MIIADPPVANKNTAKLVIGLLYLNLALLVLQVLLYVLVLQQRGQNSGLAVWLALNIITIEQVFNTVTILSYLGCGVAFSVWTYRMYANQARLEISHTEVTPFAAAIGYFIPFVNLYLPYKYLTEIWENLQFVISKHHGQYNETRLIGFWWLIFVISILTDRVGIFFVKEYESIITLVIIAILLRGIAAILAINVIKRFVAVEEEAISRYLNQGNQHNDIYNSLVH